MNTTTIQVKEIHCSSCEQAIRTALGRLPGVAAVKPSAERNDVQVSFDDHRVSMDQLRASLEEIGYEPLD